MYSVLCIVYYIILDVKIFNYLKIIYSVKTDIMVLSICTCLVIWTVSELKYSC